MKDPFVEKPRTKKPGFNVGVVLGTKAVKGAVGIEVEVEGNKFPKPPGCEGSYTPVKMPGWKFWSYVHDGSLRGKDNAEYVLTKPIEFSQVVDAVNELFTKLNEFGSVLDDSNRTSVHVHLNCQDFHFNRLAALMALHFTFEEVLTQWCGEHRVGNLFCLRSRDASAIISHIRKFLRSDGRYEFGEGMHYAGFNASALRKHGSVEIRTLRGVNDPQVIIDWVETLQRLYELSASYTDPREVCEAFSANGPNSFFNLVLGNKAAVIRAGVNFSEDQLRESLYKGIRLAQDICFCRDWSMYKPSTLKNDPFKRDMRKIAKKIMSYELISTEEPPIEYDHEEDLPTPVTVPPSWI
jgi:hypothetical protein